MYITVIHLSWCWSKGVRKAPRPIESVILDENLAADIIEDGKQFMDSREWYGENEFCSSLCRRFGLRYLLIKSHGERSPRRGATETNAPSTESKHHAA